MFPVTINLYVNVNTLYDTGTRLWLGSAWHQKIHSKSKISIRDWGAWSGPIFQSQEKCQYTPRHYAVIQIQCRDLKEAVTLRPNEALKRANPSIWADTYYVDPFKVGINALTQLTTDPQVNQTQVESIPTLSSSSKAKKSTSSRCGPEPPAEEPR